MKSSLKVILIVVILIVCNTYLTIRNLRREDIVFTILFGILSIGYIRVFIYLIKEIIKTKKNGKIH